MPSNIKTFFRPFLVKSALVAVLALSACPASTAQTSLTQILQPSSTPATSGKPADPLNRTTPSGSVLGFLQAAQSGDYTIAAQYLQMSASHRQTEGEKLAEQLKEVMDRSFVGRVGSFTQPEGIPQEGVPLGRQKLGAMSSGDVEVDLDLVRVSDPSAGKIWLISAETLAKVPELYDQVQARAVESKLPAVLVKHQIAGMPLWQWLALVLALPVSAGIGWLALALLGIPLRWWAKRHGQLEIANRRSVSGPAWLLVGTFAHQIFARYVGMPLLQRHYYFQFTSIALIIGATWIAWHIVRWFLRRVRNRALARGHAGTGSLMLLGERIVKAAIFVTGLFFILADLGVSLTTALAGVGIGGLAIGFGAQQTIANLFGGVSVLGDEVIRVGDVCTFGDRTGTVEDIGLRSTRIRTEERTLVAIPNGTVATINVENLSRRDKILFKTKLNLHPETTASQLRTVLSEVRRLLENHSKIESATVRVRLIDISGGQHTAESVCYILTRDFNEFAAVREELLFSIMDIVEQAGSALAHPNQAVLVSQDGKAADRQGGKQTGADEKAAQSSASSSGSQSGEPR
jgi:MscS family membrane protein